MTMATSGLAYAIQSLDFSNPENTRFQYGSSVCLLSIAAPIAGTCDDATPAVILATFRPRLAARFRFGFRFGGFGLCGFGLCGFGLGRFRRGLARHLARPAAVAFDRAAAREHHRGVIVLGRSRHGGGEVAERVPVGRAE